MASLPSRLGIEIGLAQDHVYKTILKLGETGEMPRDAYVRYLSHMFHMTRGVIKHFFIAAAHESMASRKELRQFLLKFGEEEESHFRIAASDLKKLGAEPSSANVLAKYWHTVFLNAANEKPFFRLGAACVLENMATKADGKLGELIGKTKYLNASNSVYLIVHRHGPDMDHGNEVLHILQSSNMSPKEESDLVLGAKEGRIVLSAVMDFIVTGKIDKKWSKKLAAKIRKRIR